MDESKLAPSTGPETVREMHGSTSNDQSINAVDHEQSKNINPVPETHTTEPDLPVIPDG